MGAESFKEFWHGIQSAELVALPPTTESQADSGAHRPRSEAPNPSTFYTPCMYLGHMSVVPLSNTELLFEFQPSAQVTLVRP